MSKTEENLDAMRGYKSTLNNSNSSDEVKGPDKVQLDQDIGRDQYCKKIDDTGGDQNKDLRKVPAEPEAAQNSPGIANMNKKKAYDELIRMGGETPEEY
ncbi:uncharacterized protein N7469_002030 [Penicillium citrinum]|uniref:Uncharacterized protein n=1 Tax=Penicillium citrinum TaxID=5077 RepID=A0A9W9P9I2_PENCI|nr:uncharacterized protein N7469_002030 [Penicillium citrinum]KAJ5240439.1 hypothetical protein N7469_002030 [Penicillium citrinum]